MDGWMDGRTDGRTDSRACRHADGRADRQRDRRTERARARGGRAARLCATEPYRRALEALDQGLQCLCGLCGPSRRQAITMVASHSFNSFDLHESKLHKQACKTIIVN